MRADEGPAVVRLRRTAIRWLPAVSVALAGVVLLASGGVVSLTMGLALLLAAVAVSPLLFPPPPLDDAAARAQAAARGVPLIYWRPGCAYCVRLRLALGRRGRRAVWVDVSRDERASARVRDVNGGDETVPTVFVGEDAHTNPSPGWVRDRLAA
jgi:glutaredoxin